MSKVLMGSLDRSFRFVDSGLQADLLGKVWVAFDSDLNREVALKEIRPENAGHPEMWRRFVKEAQVTERGLCGDRAYGLVDQADGKVATAKNPRKWPHLFDYRAALSRS